MIILLKYLSHCLNTYDSTGEVMALDKRKCVKNGKGVCMCVQVFFCTLRMLTEESAQLRQNEAHSGNKAVRSSASQSLNVVNKGTSGRSVHNVSVLGKSANSGTSTGQRCSGAAMATTMR